MAQNTQNTSGEPSHSNKLPGCKPFAEFLLGSSRLQAANMLVHFRLASIKQRMRSQECRFQKNLSKEENTLLFVKGYLNDPKHAELKKAVEDSIYYGGGDYTPLINTLCHGI